MKARFFVTGLVLMATTAFANAQNTDTIPGNTPGNGRNRGVAFVDNNKNGVCDNFENRQTDKTVRRGFGNGKANGKGFGRGMGKGAGRNFIDANKNGICDHRES